MEVGLAHLIGNGKRIEEGEIAPAANTPIETPIGLVLGVKKEIRGAGRTRGAQVACGKVEGCRKLARL